jgi:ATP-dependent RNA helicase RhlE
MTGSGKTAAFLLPILHRLIDRPRGATRALVLTPTRELAAQILEDLNDLAVHTPITGAVVIGGVGMGPQEHAFRSGVDVIVATPGRLLDHMRSSYVKFGALEHLVIDEADRMLDMGFLPDIRRVLRHLPAKRQTLFFSATLPAPIVSLTREMLRDPATINVQRKAAPAVGITQAVYPVEQEQKAALLVALLERGDIDEALVFTRTKHRCDRLARMLVRAGVKAERIHGDRSQSQRTAALSGFKRGKHRVLVATDIAARGIDVEALGHVVNFDVPRHPDDYIHRVGRTARAELTGDAFTFVAPEEEEEMARIEEEIGRRLPRVMVPDFEYGVRVKPRGEGRGEARSARRGGAGGSGRRHDAASRGRGASHRESVRESGAGGGAGGEGAGAPAPASPTYGRRAKTPRRKGRLR